MQEVELLERKQEENQKWRHNVFWRNSDFENPAPTFLTYLTQFVVEHWERKGICSDNWIGNHAYQASYHFRIPEFPESK